MIKRVTTLALGGCLVVGGCRQNDHARHSHAGEPHVRTADDDHLPGGVKAAFDREFPEATITGAKKQTHADGAVHWEIQYRDRSGQVQSVEFDPDRRRVPRP